jgi:hypothetical protein
VYIVKADCMEHVSHYDSKLSKNPLTKTDFLCARKNIHRSQTICYWVSYKMSPTASIQRTHIYIYLVTALVILPFRLVAWYQATRGTYRLQLLADKIPTHRTLLCHNARHIMYHYYSSIHMLYTHHSPLVQLLLPVM